MDQDQVIMIATRATPDRDYRIEFLNAFAYPKGHHVFFRYRARWISDQIRTNISQLRGQRALLIFCAPNVANEDYQFYPVRYCRIVGVDLNGSTNLLSDDDSVVLRMELGDFVHADLLVNGGLHLALERLIKDSNDRPQLEGTPLETVAKFLFSRVPQ
jgi:hypothetical protein